jgi:hypothetical protein
LVSMSGAVPVGWCASLPWSLPWPLLIFPAWPLPGYSRPVVTACCVTTGFFYSSCNYRMHTCQGHVWAYIAYLKYSLSESNGKTKQKGTAGGATRRTSLQRRDFRPQLRGRWWQVQTAITFFAGRFVQNPSCSSCSP